MQCRCVEKDQCNRNIAILENAQWRFNGVNGWIHSFGEDVEVARLKYHECLTASRLQKCVTYIGQLDEDVSSVRDSADGKISSTLSDLYHEFEELDREDFEYHEEERRKEEEAEEEARRAEEERQRLAGKGR